MKRILIVSPMPPRIGGISVSSKRLYDNLKNDGYDVHYYSLNPRYNNKPGIALRFLLVPFHILFHKKYDVIHCHVSGVPRRLILGLSRFLFKGAKLIFTIHGDVTDLLKKMSGVFALGLADRIICVQPGDSSKIPANIRSRCVDIPAFIMPNNVTEDNIPANVLDFAKDKGCPLLIINGGLVLSEPYHDLYGFQDTVDVYKELHRKGIRCRLLMIVNGDRRDKRQMEFMQKIREQISDDPQVLLVEFQKFELLPLFRYAKIYMRPTKTDGDSLSVREALAMHCAVVASDKAIRPEGTIVYHTCDELLERLEVLLTKEVENGKRETIDFYAKIKEQYELD